MTGPIVFECGKCGTTIRAPETAAGRTGKCRSCSASITVPSLPIVQQKAEVRILPPTLVVPPAAPQKKPSLLWSLMGALFHRESEAVKLARIAAKLVAEDRRRQAWARFWFQVRMGFLTMLLGAVGLIGLLAYVGGRSSQHTPRVAPPVSPSVSQPKPANEPVAQAILSSTSAAPSTTRQVETDTVNEPVPMPVEAAQSEAPEADSDVEVVDNVENVSVKNVVYGDNTWVNDKAGKSKQVKLRGIDAPDPGQKLSNDARNALAALILDKPVEIHWIDRDSSAALMADIYAGDEWINLRMVRDGWAWYDSFAIENDDLRDAQNEAKKEKRGIWALERPESPWAYRLAKQGNNAAAARAAKKPDETEKHGEPISTYVPSESPTARETGGSGGTVQVKGHYRTSKTGKVYYVRPHSRKK